MKYKDLKLQKEEIVSNTIKINGQDVIVKTDVSIQDMYEIVKNTIKKSYQEGFYDSFLIDMYLSLYLVTFYTDIEFDKEDWEDVAELYDVLDKSGALATIISAIGKDTVVRYYDLIENEIFKRTEREISMAATIGGYLNQLPELMEEASNIVQNFDPEKYQAVIDFATAANGNRPIPMK